MSDWALKERFRYLLASELVKATCAKCGRWSLWSRVRLPAKCQALTPQGRCLGKIEVDRC